MTNVVHTKVHFKTKKCFTKCPFCEGTHEEENSTQKYILKQNLCFTKCLFESTNEKCFPHKTNVLQTVFNVNIKMRKVCFRKVQRTNVIRFPSNLLILQMQCGICKVYLLVEITESGPFSVQNVHHIRDQMYHLHLYPIISIRKVLILTLQYSSHCWGVFLDIRMQQGWYRMIRYAEIILSNTLPAPWGCILP